MEHSAPAAACLAQQTLILQAVDLPAQEARSDEGAAVILPMETTPPAAAYEEPARYAQDMLLLQCPFLMNLISAFPVMKSPRHLSHVVIPAQDICC